MPIGVLFRLRAGGTRAGSGLAEAAVAANLGGCVEEDFDLGVGKDGGADVAAFHDDSTGFAEGALLLNHPCTEAGMDGDLGGGGGDVGLADAAGDVNGVEQDAIAFELGLERDAGAGGEVHERSFLVEGVVVLDGLEGEGAVHGSGFEVEEAEAACEMSGEGAFAGAGGAVDGDDGAFASFRRGIRLLRVGEILRGLRHSEDLFSSGLNFRAGARLPKGFLFPLNLSKVPAGLPVVPAADLP